MDDKVREVKIGDIVYVRYLDHAHFKHIEPINCEPFTNEAIGWLTHDCDQHIRIVYEWQRNAINGRRSNGFVILKSCISEMYKLDVNSFKRQLGRDVQAEV